MCGDDRCVVSFVLGSTKEEEACGFDVDMIRPNVERVGIKAEVDATLLAEMNDKIDDVTDKTATAAVNAFCGGRLL